MFSIYSCNLHYTRLLKRITTVNSLNFEFQWRLKIFLFSKTFRLALEPPGHLFNGYQGSFLGVKVQSMIFTTLFHLALRLRMSGAILLFPLCLHGVYRNNFTSSNSLGNIHKREYVHIIWCGMSRLLLSLMDVSLQPFCLNNIYNTQKTMARSNCGIYSQTAATANKEWDQG